MDSIIQQLGPVFVYDRADFSLIVGSQCVGPVLLLFFGGGEGGSQLGRLEVSAFFSQATSFEICFGQDKTFSGCQRGL